MDVLYIGSKDAGYEINIYCRKNKFHYDLQNEDAFSIKDNTAKLLSIAPKFLFIEIESITDEIDSIIDSLEKISKAVYSNVVIVAIGYDITMRIIKQLIAGGIRNFIFEENLTRQYKEIESIMQGESSLSEEECQKIVSSMENKITDILSAIPEVDNQTKHIAKKIKIAVVGCRDRIGTTTVALQLAKYLQLKTLKPCYIERNNTKFLKTFAEFIEGSSEDKSTGKITYDGLDLFYKLEIINKVLSDAYEYYIYDYGSIAKADSLSLLEQDIIISVCGNFPSEVSSSDLLYERLENHNCVFYIFNYVSAHDYDNIYEYQRDKRDRTFFFVNCPDPFFII